MKPARNDWISSFVAGVPVGSIARTSVETMTGEVHSAIPDPSSPQVNVTVTSVLCHPASLGCGETEADMAGGIVSSSNMAKGDSVLTCPQRIWLAESMDVVTSTH